MNHPLPFRRILAKRAILAAFALGCVISAANLHAQDDPTGNPTGNSGSFNGEVTTGCAYDPLTGNAKRVVTDLAVPGSNGAYPLAFTRYNNSRITAVGNDYSSFGDGGNWRHSYQWAVSTDTDSLGHTSYTIAYPDGRVIKFRIGRTTAPSGETWLRGQPGLSDRLEADTSTTLKLHLGDGGVVHFTYNSNSASYLADQIIDPYGATTTLSNPVGRLATITEPGGRTLGLSYGSYTAGGMTWTVLTNLTSSNGQSVSFGYQPFQTPEGMNYYVLSSVTYNAETSTAGNGSLVTASYSYQLTPKYRPLLQNLDDPHYSGAMTHLRYAYIANPAYRGLIASEQNANSGVNVSSLKLDNPASVTNALETRGDQGVNSQGATGTISRQFLYGQASAQGQPTSAAAYQVTSAGDFDGNVSYTLYNDASLKDTAGQGYIHATIDPLSNQTTYVTEPYTGKVTGVQLPDGRWRYAEWANPTAKDTLHPYYQYSATDERNHTTRYNRPSANHLVTSIDYADGSHEYFSYQSFTSGGASYYKLQLYTNQLGGTITYKYGSSPKGSEKSDLLVSTSKDYGYGQTAEVTNYKYDTLDRLIKVSDARGVSESFTYTGRNQLASVTHADARTQLYAYDDYGNQTSVTDEWHHVGLVAYDEYRRPTTVTKAADSSADARSVTYSYRRQDTSGTQIADALTHTSGAWSQALTKANRGTRRTFTNGGQVATERVGLTTNNGVDLYDSPPASTTTAYVYNGNHQISKVTGPSGNVTNTSYDNCGRLKSVTDPNNHVTSKTYYPANAQYYPGLLQSVTVPGNNAAASLTTQFVSYDNVNHLLAVQDPAAHQFNDTTDFAGNPTTQDDGNGSTHNVTYKYDAFGRKLKATQPDSSNEKWTYDLSGNVDTHTARNAAVQTFSYDKRNRPKGYTWSDSTNPLTISYDDNAQTMTVQNNWATSLVYYNAAHEAYREDQLITGQSQNLHSVTVSFDADGLPRSCSTPSGGSQQWIRDQAGNLTSVSDQTLSSPQGSFTYANQRLIQTDYAPGFTNLRSYQPNGRVSQTVFKRYGGANICVRDYGFYPDGQKSWMYEETSPGYLPASYGNAYYYNADGSMNLGFTAATGTYGGYDSHGDGSPSSPSGGRVSGAASRTGSDFDAAGNRTTYTENGLNTTYSSNTLNEYTGPFTYDLNANLTFTNGFTYAYDSENRLRSAKSSGHAANFYYDGFGRLDYQVIDGVGTYFYFLGDKIAEERNTDDGWTSNYVFGAGGERFCQYAPSGLHQYYHYDDAGHVTHVTDSNGNVREQYAYDPFGQPYIYTGVGTTYLYQTNIGNRRMFNGAGGYDWYPEVGLYHVGARWYSPLLGRFMQPDPIGQEGGLNQYAYCCNDPINRSDPDGLAGGTDVEHPPILLDSGGSDNDKPDQLSDMIYGLPDDEEPSIEGSSDGPIGSGIDVGNSAGNGNPAPIIGTGDGTGPGNGQGGVETLPAIIGTGYVAFDDDGSGTNYSSGTTHRNRASGMMGDGGRYVPRLVPKFLPTGALNPSKYAEKFNPLGRRQLNADTDSYGVAPSNLWDNGRGPLEIGDRMVGIYSGGRIATTIGDFGPRGGFGEFSMKALSDNGFSFPFVKGKFRLKLGNSFEDIPITVYYYPNTH